MLEVNVVHFLVPDVKIKFLLQFRDSQVYQPYDEHALLGRLNIFCKECHDAMRKNKATINFGYAFENFYRE